MNEEISRDVIDAVTRLIRLVKSSSIYHQFTSYPHQKNVSYTTHAWRNAKESIKVGMIAFQLWIHAFFPFLFQSVTSSLPPTEQTEQKEQKEQEEQRLKTE
jgi:hypothetical protein